MNSPHSCDIWPIFFQVMTLNPVCENVETAQGVPLTVTGVAQVTIVQLESSWIELFTLELNLLHLMVVILRIEFKHRDEIHQSIQSVTSV